MICMYYYIHTYRIINLFLKCIQSFIQLVSSGFAASGPGRCKINNGGCWHEARNGHAYSACLVSSY